MSQVDAAKFIVVEAQRLQIAASRKIYRGELVVLAGKLLQRATTVNLQVVALQCVVITFQSNKAFVEVAIKGVKT